MRMSNCYLGGCYSGGCCTGVALAITGALLVSCSSLTTGNEGNLTFAYIADEDLLDFNKPIAVGALLDLRVTEVGSQRAVEITSVTSGDTSVLEVVSFEGATVTATVLDQFRGKKGVAFKFKRRKGYHKTKGYRRCLTKLEITSIAG